MSGQVSRGSAGDYQADERAGVARLSWLRNVEPPTRPRLECRRETGLILRCDRKVGNPFQTNHSRLRSTPISRSPLDKNPMPGHLSELQPVNEVNTKGQFSHVSFGKNPRFQIQPALPAHLPDSRQLSRATPARSSA